MKHIPLRALALAVAALALVAVSIVATASAKTQATTTITFWSTMNDEENETLKGLISKYEAQNNAVKIDLSAVPFDQRENKFSAAAQAGRRPTSCGRRSPTSPTGRRGASSPTSRARSPRPTSGTSSRPRSRTTTTRGRSGASRRRPTRPRSSTTSAWSRRPGSTRTSRPATLTRAPGLVQQGGQGEGHLPAGRLVLDAGLDLGVRRWTCSTSQSKQILVANKRSIAGMTAYKRQFSANCAFPNKDFANDYGNAQTAFKNGQVAMIVNGPWSTADILQGKEFAKSSNLGVAPIPKGPGGQGSPVGGQRLRDQPQRGQRRRDVPVHLLAHRSLRSRPSLLPRTTCFRPARRRTSRRR